MNRKEHLLTILIEECAEIQKDTSKALRFGLNDFYNTPPCNKEKISTEVADLMGIYSMLVKEGVLDHFPEELIERKKNKIEKFLLYSKERGTLTK
jgi:hypothetical protein